MHRRFDTFCAAALLTLAALAPVPALGGDSGPLPADGREPTAGERRAIEAAVCQLADAAAICRCGSEDAARRPRLHRILPGQFTAASADEALAHFEGCGRAGTALLERGDADGESGEEAWRVADFYPDLHTHTCRRFDLADADLVVCHRALDGKTWRIGLLHALDFRGGTPVRRQLASWRSNARGCPSDTLRTTHPIGWRTWHAADDPRAALMTLFLQHRNGVVPDRFPDACTAMDNGRQVFGKKHRLARYFELDGRRFVDSGTTEMVGEAASRAHWRGDERVDEPVCRQKDVHRQVRQHAGRLQRCYAAALRSDETAAGTVELEWRVGRDGAVSKTRVVADEIDDPDLTACLRRVVDDFAFTPPRAGDSCTFVYPFEFAPE